jgi:hypothetical protein
LTLDDTHQLVVYTDDINILDESIHTIEKNTAAFVFISKKVGLEVNAEKTICPCPVNRMQDKITT